MQLVTYPGFKASFLYNAPRDATVVGSLTTGVLGLVLFVEQPVEADDRSPVITPWIRLLASDGQLGWIPDYVVTKIFKD